jgi:hypothetical protein
LETYDPNFGEVPADDVLVVAHVVVVVVVGVVVVFLFNPCVRIIWCPWLQSPLFTRSNIRLTRHFCKAGRRRGGRKEGRVRAKRDNVGVTVRSSLLFDHKRREQMKIL